MFQNFDAPSRTHSIGNRLRALREEIRRHDLDGLIVPHADEYQGEYTPASAERLAWLTGFTGSAGAAIVLADRAAVFVDGRYTLQVREQVDIADFTPEHLIETPPHVWLKRVLKPAQRIGYDPLLLTVAEVRRFEEACQGADAVLVPVEHNLIDVVWADRPAPPRAAVVMQPDSLAGETAAAKIARMQAVLDEKNVEAAIITQSDSIAWLFNLRGRDVPHNPVALSYALLRRQEPPTLYIDSRKLSNAIRDELANLADIKEEAALKSDIAALGAAGARVLADPQSTPAALAGALANSNGVLVEGSDPIVLPKARKNDVELAGTRKAHRRDGVAVTRFLAWFDDAASKGDLTEIVVAQKLEAFRAAVGEEDGMPLQEVSFDTISGAGPDGAIVHHRVNRATDRRIEHDTLVLVDSGAQFQDGTTDITRTLPVGTPSDEMRDRFTRVLKGHIALATARFPKGTTGAQLDTLARHALWQAGLDYDHGTGHGVGVFLSVHEGPARISKAAAVPLEPGMILSNEPGYYKAGAYGIRIENLIVVNDATPIAGGDRDMLSFETITLAPIDRRLIKPDLMSDTEIGWLDAYHRRVHDTLGPSLTGEALAFLEKMTTPLGA